jgi:hypothetical protein
MNEENRRGSLYYMMKRQREREKEKNFLLDKIFDWVEKKMN